MTCRWRALSVLIAVAFAAYAVPAPAQPKPKNPSLAIEPVSAQSLLAPAESDWKLSLTESERGVSARTYRLGPEGEGVTGQRARLSLELGDTTVFAIGGTLGRRNRAGPPDPADTSQRRLSGSKQYGAGIERTFGPVEVSANYQYSKVNAERSESNLRIDNPKSHSVRATARIKFRH